MSGVLRRRSLGNRLALLMVLFCLLFSVLTAGLRTWNIWEQNRLSMDAELQLLEQVYQSTLAKAIWELDKPAVQAHLDGALRIPSVGRIELRLAGHGEEPEVQSRQRADWAPSSLAPSRYCELVYSPYPGGREVLGELLIQGSEPLLWRELRDSVAGTLLTQLVLALLLAGLVSLAFNRLVTLHVRRIARHLSRLSAATLAEPLRLQRPARQDELDLLVSGINALQGNLADHLARQHRQEEELAAHRDRLADRVRERTAELEALATAQQIILGLSNQLIHAPYERFDQHCQLCLREVAQRLRARQACWFKRHAQDAPYRLYQSWSAEAEPAQGLMTLPTACAQVLEARLEPEVPYTFATREALVTAFGDAAEPLLALGNQALALVHLRIADDEYGLLLFGCALGGEWRTDERALINMTTQLLLHASHHQAQLRDLLASQEALRSANARLEELSLSDPLTGLANRRCFDEAEHQEFRRARRSGLALSLLLCDIDFFKRYNDTYGHAQGDLCLQRVAAAMRQVVTRSGDLVARIGGEEFAVLLPATDLAGAGEMAERLRRAVSALEIVHAGSEIADHVTLSIGYASLSAEMPDFAALMEQADRALYRAKSLGRQRSCQLQEEPPL